MGSVERGGRQPAASFGRRVDDDLVVFDLANNVVGDEQRCDGSDRDNGRANPHRRDESVHISLRIEVRAVGREHGRQDGDAEDATNLADRVVGAGGLAFLVAANRGEDDVGDRCEEHAHAGAADDERQDD